MTGSTTAIQMPVSRRPYAAWPFTLAPREGQKGGPGPPWLALTLGPACRQPRRDSREV
jgi:hypothetical protein